MLTAQTRAQIAHYRDVYRRFGAEEGARALDRVLVILDGKVDGELASSNRTSGLVRR